MIKKIWRNFLRAGISFLGFKHDVTQWTWGRELYGGAWYLINPRGLSMGSFWSDKRITSCQSEVIKCEFYKLND